MKRILIFLFFLLFVLSLTACKKTQSSSSSSTTSISAEVTTNVNSSSSESGTSDADSMDLYSKVKYKVSLTKSQFASPQASSIACAQLVLNYYGLSVTQNELLNYLEVAPAEFYQKNGLQYGPDTSECFVGDPNTTVYGCDSNPILNMCLKAVDSKGTAKISANVGTGGSKKTDYRNKLSIVWLVENRANNSSFSRWMYEGSMGDGDLVFPKAYTCVVVIGATDNSVIVADPISNKITEYSNSEFDSMCWEYISFEEQ